MILKELIVRLKAEGANDVKRQVDDLNRSLNLLTANQRRAFQQMTQFQQRFAGAAGGANVGMIGGFIGTPNQINQTTASVKALGASLTDLYTAFKVSELSGSRRAARRRFEKGFDITGISRSVFEMPYGPEGRPGALGWNLGTEIGREQQFFVGGKRSSRLGLQFAIARAQLMNRLGLGSFTGMTDEAMEPTDIKNNDFFQTTTFNAVRKLHGQFELSAKGVKVFDSGLKALNFTGNVAQNVLIALTGATLAYSAALGKLGISAMQAASSQEDLDTRLLALTGSASKVQQLNQLFKDIAGPSAFTMEQIADAGVNLQAYGVNVNRTLPLIAMLGQAFGASNEQLQMYVGFIGRLKGGYLDETLGRLGITKADLSARGIQFDAGGSLKSSAEKTMVAIEAIVKQKYGNIFNLTKDNASTMAASITDAFQIIQKQGGEVLLTAMKPLMRSFGEVAMSIAESGISDSIYRNIYMPFMLALGAINDSPNAIAKTLVSIIVMFEEFSNNISRVMLNVARMATLNEAGAYGPRAEGVAAGVFDMLYGEFGPQSPEKRTAELMKIITGGLNKPGRGFPGGGGGNFFDRDTTRAGAGEGAAAKNTRNLERIANNTKKSADLLDLRRQTIGGGPIASLGLTGAELARMGFKMRSDISLRGPMRPATGIERGFRDLIRSEGYSASTGIIPIR